MLPLTTLGSPALGRHETGRSQYSLSWRSGSYISTGPVAQLRPITSMPSGLNAVIAAPISVPGSMRPVSSIVTWAGCLRFDARLHVGPGPLEHLADDLGDQVVFAGEMVGDHTLADAEPYRDTRER